MRLRQTWVLAAIVGLGMGVMPSESRARQETPKNLQHFPPETSRADLIQEMRGFSFALGVRCQYCHVGGDGVSFEGVVFESDDDPDKRKTRFMLRMVETLNQSMLPLMADRDEPGAEITCKTCHRGLPKPALLTDVLQLTLDEHGVDSATAQYRGLRDSAGMAGTFDFGEWETNFMAERLAADERFADAIAVYELNLDFYPQSVSILLALGELHERIEDSATAIGYYQRALETAPGNARARGRLEALRGG